MHDSSRNKTSCSYVWIFRNPIRPPHLGWPFLLVYFSILPSFLLFSIYSNGAWGATHSLSHIHKRYLPRRAARKSTFRFRLTGTKLASSGTQGRYVPHPVPGTNLPNPAACDHNCHIRPRGPQFFHFNLKYPSILCVL